MMEENRRDVLQELDAEWDVEQFLAQKRGELLPKPTAQQNSAAPSEEKPQKAERPVNRPRTQTATAERPAALKKPSKKQKINYRGWAQLILAAVLVVAIIVVLIVLIGKIFSGPSVPEETVPIESTQSREQVVSDLITRADRLASGYDYEGAVSVLREYGEDWTQQPELSEANARYQSAQSLLVKFSDVSKVSMLSFHSLIADPARAFDGGAQESYYRDYMVTVTECKAILQELYNKNYILVSIHDLYKTGSNGEYAPAELYLPDGKKPLILVQDDLNYGPTMTDGNGDGYADKDGDGFASKLVLDANGLVTCEYIAYDGQTMQGDYDLVPVLETFIGEHPDFSYRGARGILSLTGADGVFGYHTSSAWKSKLDSAAYSTEVSEARKIADALKAQGWEFASHTYGHISYGDAKQDELTKDLGLWKDEVQSIVGATDLLMYPKGGGLIGSQYGEGDLYKTIYSYGFRLFCTIDTETTELRFFDTYLRVNRTPVGGQWFNGLDDFFNGSKIKDPARK